MKHPIDLQAIKKEAEFMRPPTVTPVQKNSGKIIPLPHKPHPDPEEKMEQKGTPLFYEYRFKAKDHDPL